MIKLNVPYLSHEQLVSFAIDFLVQNSITSIPVDIEDLIENNYQMDIVPIPSMQAGHDFESSISSDLTEIYVDDYVYKNNVYRYRFSIAHELGHRVLHHKYLSGLSFSSISEWANVVSEIDTSDHSKMEYQAYMFAGLVLVPADFLRDEFKDQLSLFGSQITKAQAAGIERNSYVGTVLNQISYQLSSRFMVSSSVMNKRIEFESLYELIQ